ncbi:MAG TPA: efflux transporter outer membrane subunit, partial [Burkholderiaceae bacterium]
ALKANPDLQAALAALRVAQENARAQYGTLLPAVDASYSPTRQKVADPLSSPLSSGQPLFSLHTAQVNVSYVADVFGANRRQVESLEAQEASQRFQLEAARVTLAANTVAAAVQLASLRAQIAATEHTIDESRQQLVLMHRQLDLGAIAEAAVVAQQAALAQTQAALPPLRRQLAQQRDLLAALSGSLPAEAEIEDFDLSDLQAPDSLPLSLPSNLVEQRPDVRAAEAQLHAASAQIGVATANMLPQITLGANAGGAATRFADLFTSGTGFWSIAAGVTQPLFQGGALLHRKRAAEAAFDQAAAQYRSTVITAFQNVADVLEAIRSDADALDSAQRAEQATAESLSVARRQMELGDIAYLALLAAEQAHQQALVALAQARAARLTDAAALFQALGGGWWNAARE